MRRLLLAAMLALGIPSLGEAAPCLSQTLQDYINLGSGGCTVGAALFADFSSTTLSPFATEIPAGDVNVSPLVTGIGLAFGLDVSAGPGDLFDILIRYAVSGPLSFVANSLAMSGSAAAGDGVVTAVEDTCLGGTFAGPGPVSCSGTPMTLIVFDIGSDQGLFATTAPPLYAPTSFFDVFTEIAVDGGVAGTAELRGVVTSEFTEVPEPSTFVLIGSGLAGIAARRRRQRG